MSAPRATVAPEAARAAALDQHIVDLLLDLLPAGRPRRLARMSKPGELRHDGTPRDKYEDIRGELTRPMLLNHARGLATYSYTLDKDDRAKLGISDVDQGGRAALLALLAAAHTLGIIAFAVENTGNGQHKGGHLICLFDAFYPATDIKARLAAMHEAAGIPATELWPGSNQGIRGLFGFHQIDQTRGDLLLQSGEIISLDTDLAAGVDAVLSLARNSAPPKAPEPPTVERVIGVINITPRASAGRASLDDVKARFNAEHTLDSLLTGYGAVKTKDGYSCPFCTHTHETTLYISKHGRLFSFSPNCKLHTTKGYDAFGLYVLIEHSDNALAAAKKLNPIEPRQKRQDSPLVEPTPARVQTSEQAQAAQRKRDARKALAAATIADVQARASQDETLSDNAQLVLLALLDYAGSRDWCRPSVARLADMLQISRRSVFYGLHDLENTYVKSEPQRGGTTRRTFIRVQAQTAENRVFAPEFIENIDLIPTLELVSGAQPAQPAGEPDEWEFWQPAEWECSGYDLALESDEAEPAELRINCAFSEIPEIAEPQQEAPEAAPLVEQCEAPPLVEQPAPIWRLASDKRDMWFLRGPAAECIVFGRDEGAARQALAAMTPAAPEQPHQDAPISPMGESVPAGPQAFYDPGAALQLGGEYTGKPKHYADFETRWAWSSEAIKPRASSPTVINALDPRFAEQDDPQVRSAPIEPAAADRYWKLRGKAKHAKSSAQRSLLNRQADELMIWRSASDVHAARSERQESAIAPPSQAPARRAAVAQQGAFL